MLLSGVEAGSLSTGAALEACSGIDPEACREGVALVAAPEAAAEGALDCAAWAGDPLTVLGTLPGTWGALNPREGSLAVPFGVDVPVLGVEPSLEDRA